MTSRELDMIRPWIDAKCWPVDAGYKPPASLLRRGLLVKIVDNFYALTNRGKDELELLTGRLV